MTRADSPAGDSDPFRTPGLNSSVQTSMNDHGEHYYLCHNEGASVISYLKLILAVKSCQDRLNLNETRRRYFKYELQIKI